MQSSAHSSLPSRRSGERLSGSDSIKEVKMDRHLVPPCVAEEMPSKGKNIFSRVNKLFKSPRRHHRKPSDTRSEDGAGLSEPDDVDRASEVPLASNRLLSPSASSAAADALPAGVPPSPEHQRRRPQLPDMAAADSTAALEASSCKEPPLGASGETPSPKPSPALHALQTPSRSVADTGSDAGGGAQVTPPRWDEAFVDVEVTTELLMALREKMAALNGEIQKEMGTGATNLKDFLATLDDSGVNEKNRQNARKNFERSNRSRSKRLQHLQHRLEQLMQVSLEIQKSGVPKGREPEEYAKSLMVDRKGKTGVLNSVKQSWGGAVENVKGAAGSLSRSLKKPVRSNSLDNLPTLSSKDRSGTSEEGEPVVSLPRVSTTSRILASSNVNRAPSAPSHSNSDPSEAPPNMLPTSRLTASSSGGNGAGTGLGLVDNASSTRDRRSVSECSPSNSSLREEVSQLRTAVDEIRQQMEDNNYAVESNRLDLRRNAEFYRSGLEETNSKMERLEELFNESVNSLKDDVHALGEQLEYRFNERLRCLRDNMEALRNQQALFERRFDQHFRGIGSLDTGEAYAPSLLKTRLLDLLIAVFNLLVFLLSAAFQLGLRLANLGSLLRQHPGPAFAAGLALVLMLGAALARDLLWAALLTATSSQEHNPS